MSSDAVPVDRPSSSSSSPLLNSRRASDRINLIRLIAVAAFYAVEVLNYFNVSLGPLGFPDEVYAATHSAITAIAIAWVLLGSAAAFAAARIRWFPAFATVADLFLLSLLLCVAGGPRGPMVVGYFLVIVLSGLRFNLGVVRLATIGSVVAYLCVCGYARWYAADPASLVVPRYHQLIVLIALGLTGVIVGQIVREAQSAVSLQEGSHE